MAGSAKSAASKDLVPVEPTHPNGHSAVEELQRDRLQLRAAQLYGQGLSRRRIMLALLPYLAPKEREGKRDRTQEEQEQLARTTLRRWERNEKFRDMIYEHAVAKVDLEIPEILKGVVRKGKTGRVDAARLALEVTGRHNPKGEQVAPNVTVQIANIPRPE